MAYRKEIGTHLRFKVLARDHFTCQYCGNTPEQSFLEIDHIVPVTEGGTNDIENLITACTFCNNGKSNLPLSSENIRLIKQRISARQFRDADYDRWKYNHQDWW